MPENQPTNQPITASITSLIFTTPLLSTIEVLCLNKLLGEIRVKI